MRFPGTSTEKLGPNRAVWHVSHITDEARHFDSLSARLNQILQSNRYGLIVNKVDPSQAKDIHGEVSRQAQRYLDHPIRYLGNLREARALRNISNYGRPFLVSHPDHEAVQDLCGIADLLMGIQPGSMARVLHDQRDYLKDLRKRWTPDAESGNASRTTMINPSTAIPVVALPN